MRILLSSLFMIPLISGCPAADDKLAADDDTSAHDDTSADVDSGDVDDCPTGTVSGTVTDASEWGNDNGVQANPQPNARVFAEDETGFSFESLAEADGSYELELDAGTWTLSAGQDSSCYGEEVEVEIGCEAAVADLSVVDCMGR